MLDIQNLVRVHSIGNDLHDVKVEFNRDLKIDVSGITVEGKQGEIINIPRWIADILHSAKHVEIKDEDIVIRMSGRRVHLASGRTYHIDFNPPIVENKDDLTGEDLIQRVDDNEDIVRDRLSIYHQQTQPLVNYYSDDALEGNSGTKFNAISGVGTLDEVKTRINAALES